MTAAWTPQCAEDELLVALVALKRRFLGSSVGLDPGAFPVLHHLAVLGPSRQSPLAEALGLDASTVSRHVRTLTSERLVDASRDPTDGRATVLSITERGRAYLSQRLSAHRMTLQAATSDFTPEERAELIRLLQKLATALAAHEENS